MLNVTLPFYEQKVNQLKLGFLFCNFMCGRASEVQEDEFASSLPVWHNLIAS